MSHITTYKLNFCALCSIYTSKICHHCRAQTRATCIKHAATVLYIEYILYILYIKIICPCAQVSELARANVLSASQVSTLQTVQLAHYRPDRQGVALLTVAGDGTLAFKETGGRESESKLLGYFDDEVVRAHMCSLKHNIYLEP